MCRDVMKKDYKTVGYYVVAKIWWFDIYSVVSQCTSAVARTALCIAWASRGKNDFLYTRHFGFTNGADIVDVHIDVHI